MNKIISAQKQKDFLEEELPDSVADMNDTAGETEIAQLQDDGDINLDDAIDDDNENPVSHTLIGAAENSGEETRDESRELDGEAEQDAER